MMSRWRPRQRDQEAVRAVDLCSRLLDQGAVCLGCLVITLMFRSRHHCLLEKESQPSGEYLAQLEGKKLATFLEGIMHCSPRQKVRPFN